MTDLVVFGASCVVVGLAAGVLIGLWAPPPRRRDALPPLLAIHDVTPTPRWYTDKTRPYLRIVQEPGAVVGAAPIAVGDSLDPPPSTPAATSQFIDAEALGWLEGA